jgi:hypothetical protein
MPDPFVALMRRYSIDYSSSHDLTVIDEVMVPDYVVHTCGLDLYRDPDYKPAVADIFRLFPGLGFTVHEIVTNGDRLAMRFSEHAMAQSGRLSCWRGIATYSWDGSRLTECFVEQDFYGRRLQLKSGEPDALEPPHLDPWAATVPEAADAGAEAVVTAWLAAGDLAAAPTGWIDGAALDRHVAPVTATDVTVDDLFSAGATVAFHATIQGELTGSAAVDVSEATGGTASLGVAGWALVAGDDVAAVHVVTDRLGLRTRLLGGQLVPR